MKNRSDADLFLYGGEIGGRVSPSRESPSIQKPLGLSVQKKKSEQNKGQTLQNFKTQPFCTFRPARGVEGCLRISASRLRTLPTGINNEMGDETIQFIQAKWHI